jgi:hypothetical protein
MKIQYQWSKSAILKGGVSVPPHASLSTILVELLWEFDEQLDGPSLFAVFEGDAPARLPSTNQLYQVRPTQDIAQQVIVNGRR